MAIIGNPELGIPDVQSTEELAGLLPVQPSQVSAADIPEDIRDMVPAVAGVGTAGLAGMMSPQSVEVPKKPTIDERSYLDQMDELNEQLSAVEEDYDRRVSDADFRKKDQQLDILRAVATIPAIFAGPFAVQAVQRAITDPSKREKMKYDLSVARLEAERQRLIKLEEQDLARERLSFLEQQHTDQRDDNKTFLNITGRDAKGNLTETTVEMRDKDYDRMQKSYDTNYTKDTQAQANLEAAQSMYALNNVVDQIKEAQASGDKARLNTLLTTFSASLTTVLPRIFGEVGNLSDSDKRAYIALGGEAKFFLEMVRGVFKGRKMSQPELQHMMKFIEDATLVGRNRDRNYRNKAAATALAHVKKKDRKAVHRYLINEVPVPQYAVNIGTEDTVSAPASAPEEDYVQGIIQHLDNEDGGDK